MAGCDGPEVIDKEEKAMEHLCVGCEKKTESKTNHLPRGWKLIGGESYCKECVKQQYAIRAITIPVVSPVGCSWDELRAKLRPCWQESTRASNWFMTELYKRDIRREKGQEKMPRMERQYLYPEAVKLFPSLAGNTVTSLEQTIQQKYSAIRYKLIWQSAVSLPNFRYPQPIIIHNKSWGLQFEEDGAVLVGVRLLPESVSKDRTWFRLKGGSRYRRQLAGLKQIAGGQAIAGTLEISSRTIDGKNQVLCKIVGRFPIKKEQDLAGEVWITTTPDSLLYIASSEEAKEGARLWQYHGDHIRRWSEEHRKMLYRLSEDRKAGVPVKFGQRRENAAEKYHRRMSSATHEVSAAVVKFVLRNRVAIVYYNDTDKGFCKGFPWYSLQAKIVDKLKAHGIECITSAEPAQEESA